MENLKPIETVYNGYKFRSRLEARWAVFFDAVGIKYEYEPEGFELDDGTRYLPDFRLLNVRHRSYEDEKAPVYVEVKGKMSIYDINRIAKFSKIYPIIVIGSAEQAETLLDWWNGGSFWTFEFMDGDSYPCMFVEHCNEIWLAGPDHDEWDGGELMKKAIRIVKQARFEHGECG